MNSLVKIMASLILVLSPMRLEQAALEVVVSNILVGKGSIVVEVFKEDSLFLKKPFLSDTQKAAKRTMKFSFTLASGQYAIAVYQDLNENKKLDLGLFHIPKEPYGFSNHYRPSFSAPKYKECLISISGQTQSVIELK